MTADQQLVHQLTNLAPDVDVDAAWTRTADRIGLVRRRTRMLRLALAAAAIVVIVGGLAAVWAGSFNGDQDEGLITDAPPTRNAEAIYAAALEECPWRSAPAHETYLPSQTPESLDTILEQRFGDVDGVTIPDPDGALVRFVVLRGDSVVAHGAGAGISLPGAIRTTVCVEAPVAAAREPAPNDQIQSADEAIAEFEQHVRLRDFGQLDPYTLEPNGGPLLDTITRIEAKFVQIDTIDRLFGEGRASPPSFGGWLVAYSFPALDGSPSYGLRFIGPATSGADALAPVEGEDWPPWWDELP